MNNKHRHLLIGILFLLLCSLTVSAVTVSAAQKNTTKTKISSLREKSEGKVYIAWDKKSVDGYQVRWALSSDMKNAHAGSTKKTSHYVSGLIGGRTYYFQVRTYKLTSGKKNYSGWSAKKSVKLKKLPPKTSITSLTAASDSKFTVKWKKASNVKGIQIRYSTDPSFKSKKTVATTAASKTISGLTQGTYYVSVRTYNTSSGGTKYYSPWSATKSVKLSAEDSTPASSGKVQSVSAGYYGTAILKTDGSLWMWGNNRYGQLGDGTTTTRTTPVKVMTGVKDVSAGWNHTAILKTDGSLWMCGINYDGTLGDGTRTKRSTPVRVMTGVASVSAGFGHTAILKTDGSLWMCGSNYYGELGDGTVTNRTSPVRIW